MKVFAGDISNHPMTPPYVVKPINQGSSVGIELVKDATQDIPAILRNSEWPLMVEAFVPGRELSCAIWQGKPSEVMEIRASNEFYDFDAKYTEGGSTHILPADISADIRAVVKAQTLTAHDALGCKGVTRTDFRLDETDGGYGLIILELNTQPGMTPLSLVPEMVAFEGLSYEELVNWMVEDASCQR
jgi:D-alanine-D-alanine ligase